MCLNLYFLTLRVNMYNRVCRSTLKLIISTYSKNCNLPVYSTTILLLFLLIQPSCSSIKLFNFLVVVLLSSPCYNFYKSEESHFAGSNVYERFCEVYQDVFCIYCTRKNKRIKTEYKNNCRLLFSHISFNITRAVIPCSI